MDKREVVYGNPAEKKHSVRYFAMDKNAPMESVYIVKETFNGKKFPSKIKITIEEVL